MRFSLTTILILLTVLTEAAAPQTSAAAGLQAPAAMQTPPGQPGASAPRRISTSVPYRAPAAGAPGPAGTNWTLIAEEHFEGQTWPPAGWETFDNDLPPSQNGEYCWRNVAFQGFQSPHSAWPAAGCANGLNPAASTYPDHMDSWLVYGPFSLADATAARVRFKLWQQIAGQIQNNQCTGDNLAWLASLDGTNFSGNCSVGSSTADAPPTENGWIDVVFDLGAVPGLGSVVGRTEVWLAWAFQSDASQGDNGPFLDDVIIEKQVAAPVLTVGGRGLGIRRDPGATVLTWTGGTQQSGYLVVRGSVPEDPFVPATLPGSALTFSDVGAATAALYCYFLLPLDQATPLGVSDALCLFPGTRSGATVPPEFTLRLNQSMTASLSWSTAAGADGYVLVALPLNGAPARFTALGGNDVAVTDPTGGVATCYLLVASSGARPMRNP
jgi:hypothetical protein